MKETILNQRTLNSNASSQAREGQMRETKPARGLAKLCRALFFKALAGNESGALEVILPDGERRRLGDRDDSQPAILEVLDSDFFTRTVLYGDIGFGEAYMSGQWDSPDIGSVLQWFMQNSRSTPTFSGNLARQLLIAPLAIVDRIAYLLRPNNKRMARRNIADHYDLSNDFFKTWLDDTMAYSSGIFTGPDATLHEAQLEKFERMAKKLQLRRDDHMLEIGCGWGGFAIYAAREYGCRVTGVTISREQFDLARERVRAAGLEDRVTIQFCDYRDITGQYDAIVSIEMIEALGFEYLDTFFRKCQALLAPDGIMAIQCITFPNPYFGRYRKTTDFTKKHIFPGSLLISQRELLQSLHRTGDLVIYHSESIGQHYARTLREWRLNFEARLAEVRALGFDEVFIRKWRYYLYFCETGFANNYINDFQIQFARPQNARLLNYLPGLATSR